MYKVSSRQQQLQRNPHQEPQKPLSHDSEKLKEKFSRSRRSTRTELKSQQAWRHMSRALTSGSNLQPTFTISPVANRSPSALILKSIPRYRLLENQPTPPLDMWDLFWLLKSHFKFFWVLGVFGSSLDVWGYFSYLEYDWSILITNNPF